MSILIFFYLRTSTLLRAARAVRVSKSGDVNVAANCRSNGHRDLALAINYSRGDAFRKRLNS